MFIALQDQSRRKIMPNDFKLYAPIEKIDLEKRTVAGWATTDEIDKQNEIVDYNGSKGQYQRNA
jgi:hypothetical protein